VFFSRRHSTRGDSPLILAGEATQQGFSRLSVCVDGASDALKPSDNALVGLSGRDIDEVFKRRVAERRPITAHHWGTNECQKNPSLLSRIGPPGRLDDGTCRGWCRHQGDRHVGNAIISGGSARIVGQREFKLGVGGWDVSSPRPCVRLIGYGNGGTGADLSCNPW
jgi:hypothetical protein